MSLAQLNEQVQELFGSRLLELTPDECPMSLHLLDPDTHLASFDSQKIEEIWSKMPYWAFVWSSGHALAKYLIQNPALVANKVIGDFGAGSGIVALAALQAGAQKAYAIDVDPQSLAACQLNAELNGLEISVIDSIEQAKGIDLLLVGDVLYDPRNHELAQSLFQGSLPFIWAESQAQTRLAQYAPKAKLEGHTIPNLGGFDEHKDIFIYHHCVD